MKAIDKLREHYRYALQDRETTFVKNKTVHHYEGMKMFALDMGLVSQAEINEMADEVFREQNLKPKQ